MCGRYFFTMEETLPTYRMLQQKITQLGLYDFQQGEIFPSQKVLVLVDNNHEILPTIKTWGFHGHKGTLLINARSEGIEEKITFRPHLNNRCVILANGFYEWVKQGSTKDKIEIRKKDNSLMYLAAIYNKDNQFVIVTGVSQDEMNYIHNRTPIIMDEHEMNSYLQGEFNFRVNDENLQFKKIEKKEK